MQTFVERMFQDKKVNRGNFFRFHCEWRVLLFITSNLRFLLDVSKHSEPKL